MWALVRVGDGDDDVLAVFLGLQVLVVYRL